MLQQVELSMLLRKAFYSLPSQKERFGKLRKSFNSILLTFSLQSKNMNGHGKTMQLAHIAHLHLGVFKEINFITLFF